MTQARFRVRGVLDLSSRNRLFFHGDILEGTIRPGMQMGLPLNADITIWISIDAVEMMDHSDRPAEVALGSTYRSTDERDMLLALKIEEEEVAVAEGQGRGPKG